MKWNKKNKKNKIQEYPNQDQVEEEILKAVAQAWLSRNEPDINASNEFDARKRSFIGKPTRFQIEALKNNHGFDDTNWNFNQSLWDPYEIVAISKRLEDGLVLENGLSGLLFEEDKKRKESKNSLRNLFKKVSAGRKSI